jgi:diguanylate cyclase (GGDEF)-like protein
MEKPGIPADEAERLASLKNLSILETPAEGRFDRITRLAKKFLNCKYSLISLIDSDRQWFKSAQGTTEKDLPREISFCGHAIMGDEMLVVPDAVKDPRFADNPIVTGGPGVRLYAGQPIHSPDGKRIGTLCVIDTVSRELNPEEIMVLKDLAALAENELEIERLNNSEVKLRKKLTDAERRASIDGLTRIWNRSTIVGLLDSEIERAARAQNRIAVAMIDIDHFKGINDKHGHTVGDEVLASVAERVRGAVRSYDSVGRYGGEEFMVVIVAAEAEIPSGIAENIRKQVSFSPVEYTGGRIDVTVSVGVVSVPATAGTQGKVLIEMADKALYEAKRGGRNQVVTCREAYKADV